MPNKQKTKIYVILGPTSTGKTSLAIDLCKKFNGEIISADSRQTYKNMDIGTGKLPIGSTATVVQGDQKWIIDGVNIWGYNLITPDKFFSGYDFALFALNKASELLKAGKTVFLVGGTGFYIDLFTGNVQPSTIKPNFEMRKDLENLSTDELQKLLMSLNETVYKTVDLHNRPRLIRAIEKLSSKNKTTPLPYLKNTEFVFIGLRSTNEFLYSRCDAWVDFVWQNGLLNEVRDLLNSPYKNLIKLNGLNYKSVCAFIKGELTQAEAIQRCKFDNHAYIRRQLTYFKRLKTITWFDISDDCYKDSIYNLVNG